jgi:hypothetical protein
MTVVNTVFIITGAITAVIGILAFFMPGFARIINAPGGPRLKAIIALIIGIILILVGLIVEIPTG